VLSVSVLGADRLDLPN